MGSGGREASVDRLVQGLVVYAPEQRHTAGCEPSPRPSPQAQELPRSRRRLVLAICCMSLLIVGLDNTIVNVALPSIGRELHASVSELQWTVDAYTLVLASLLMLSGSMGDRLGRRRVFQTGPGAVHARARCCAAQRQAWVG